MSAGIHSRSDFNTTQNAKLSSLHSPKPSPQFQPRRCVSAIFSPLHSFERRARPSAVLQTDLSGVRIVSFILDLLDCVNLLFGQPRIIIMSHLRASEELIPESTHIQLRTIREQLLATRQQIKHLRRQRIGKTRRERLTRVNLFTPSLTSINRFSTTTSPFPLIGKNP